MRGKHQDQSTGSAPGGDNRLRYGLFALLCTALVVGCAELRKATYPDDFVYLDRQQLKSKMALLSFYMRDLDEILMDDSTINSEQQQRILQTLNKMQAVTADLGGGVTTNHLVIDEHIDDFKSDVNRAIFNARANPPNYFALGRLSGSCSGCHKYRR